MSEVSLQLPKILQFDGSMVTSYPQIDEFTNSQLKVFWLPEEIKVAKDVQDILVNMTPAEKHGVITTLKLFTLYELKAGAEYWGGRFKETYKRTEFQRVASTYSMVELAIHQPFYQKINELLHLHTDKFYNEYVNSPVLVERLSHIDSIIDNEDNLVSLAGFTFVEGVILYSSFAFLKHFQSNGKNRLTNIVRGLNFSVRDENFHAETGAWTFRQTLAESTWLSEEYKTNLHNTVIKCAHKAYEHECDIIDMIFSEGTIDGITATDCKIFVKSRINHCMIRMGYKPIYEDIDYNPIAEWFYTGINGFTFNDTFTGISAQYHREWDETAFVYEEYQPNKSLESTVTEESPVTYE